METGEGTRRGQGSRKGYPYYKRCRLLRSRVGASPCLSRVGLFGNIRGKWPRPRRGGGGKGWVGTLAVPLRPVLEGDEGASKFGMNHVPTQAPAWGSQKHTHSVIYAPKTPPPTPGHD